MKVTLITIKKTTTTILIIIILFLVIIILLLLNIWVAVGLGLGVLVSVSFRVIFYFISTIDTLFRIFTGLQMHPRKFLEDYPLYQ